MKYCGVNSLPPLCLIMKIICAEQFGTLRATNCIARWFKISKAQTAPNVSEGNVFLLSGCTGRDEVV